MGQYFATWFLVGFILCLVSMIYTILVGIYISTSALIFKRLANLAAVVSTIGFFLWMILGTVFRFDGPGSACSETYLRKSGQFMLIYLIIMYVFFAFFICCGCCLCGVNLFVARPIASE